MSMTRANWRNPDSAFYPVPWWAWTGRMEKPEMKRQLADMKAKGIREFFIFAVYGLEYPVFLRESWFDYVGFTIETCARLGMKVWIYDDLSWPSGAAGGWALKEHPEFRMRRLECVRHELPAGARFTFDSPAPLEWVVFSDGRRPRQPIALDGDRSWVNESGRAGSVFTIATAPVIGASLNTSGISGSWNQQGYIDTLNPEAVKCWMGYIHEAYRRRFGRHFGKTVKGFFYDEPYLCRGAAPGRAVAPWTPGLFHQFRRRYRYDLRPHLEKIFFNRPGAERVRYDYWRLVSELFGRSFSRQIAGWCAAHGLISTGHAADEEPKFQRSMLPVAGEIHDTIKHNQMPGIDLLGDRTSYTAGPCWWYGVEPGWGRNLIITAKRGSSTARYAGARRVMCEAFGVRDWNCTMANQKVINDYLAGLGINFINDNSLIYTVSGFRKKSLSGKHWSQPWWKHYRLFTDYSARANAFAAAGWPEAPIALLYPTATAMALTPLWPAEPIPPEGDVCEALLASADALLRGHRDFELLFENVLTAGKVENGALKVRNSVFRVIILPQAHCLDEAVADKLAAFARSGGLLIAVGGAPGRVRLRAGRGARKSGLDCVRLPLSRHAAAFQRGLLARIAHQAPPLYRIDGAGSGDILASLRRSGNARYLLLSNQTPGRKRVILAHDLPGRLALVNPDDGVFYRPLSQNRLALTLDYGQSWIGVFGGESVGGLPPVAGAAPWHGARERTLATLGTRWEFTFAGVNAFRCPLHIRLDPYGKADEASAPPGAWLPVSGSGKFDLPFTPEESEFFQLRGEFEIKGRVPPDLGLVFDTGEFSALRVNGRPAPARAAFTLWDRNNVRVNIARQAQVGKNSFWVRCRTQKWFSPSLNCTLVKPDIVEPLAVVGTFQCCNGQIAPLPAQLKTGDWCRQGFPEYAGTIALSQTFRLSAVPGECYLRVADLFTVGEAELNGVGLGVRAWPPYCFKIPAGVLKKEENRLTLKITNSLGNLLRRYFTGLGRRAPSGLLGGVSLVERIMG